MCEKVKLCELCEEQPATLLCPECCKCYCNECTELIHSIPKKKKHKTETIPEGAKVDTMCPIHSNIPLVLFCVDETKLCCSTCEREGLHRGHTVVKVSDISEDNEVFSASEVRKRFADVLGCNDELDKKIEMVIEDIRNENTVAREKVRETFEELHKKLTEEEAKVMNEIEDVCSKCEEELQSNLVELRRVRESSKLISDFASDTQRKGSRLMELNLVSEMEEQRAAMEKLHKMTMADLKIGWNKEGRKLSFTRTLINGAPVPNSISFPKVSNESIYISWDCDESKLCEENKVNLKYFVEMEKKKDCDREWSKVYFGKNKECIVDGLEKDTEYNVRVKCVIEDLQGRWSDVLNVKTKNLFSIEKGWKRCPDNIDDEKKYSVDDVNPRITTKSSSSVYLCTIIGATPLPFNKVVSWNIKILNSRNNDCACINIGVAPFDINQSENYDIFIKCGWYFVCYSSTLSSGLPHNYNYKVYGPRKEDWGKYVHTGDSVGVVMDTTKGKLSFALNGVNYGVAYKGIPLDKPLVPCVILGKEGDSVELMI